MQIREILNEVKVQSSWISNLTYNRPNKVITWRLNQRNNHREYAIPFISRTMFDRWKAAPSKGQFYHKHIKGVYDIIRLK